MVSPFSFPRVTPAEEKDDGIVNPIGTLSVDPTVVHIEPYIPYFKLKVPQQYTLLGYKPHVTQVFISGPACNDAARPLRTGAEDEIISVASSLPHTSDTHVDILDVHTNEDDASPIVGESATNEVLTRAENQSEHNTTAGGKSRLVIPSSFFKKPKYHPLEIFNPLPGLHVLQPQVSYSKIDDDYHLCPLPRYKLTNKSGTNRPDKPFIERPDVISGLMTWKRFPCQNLVSCNNVPNITDVWIPRWTSPFMDDLLPKETPTLLNELPDDDVMSDTDSHDEEITDTPANPAVLTPAMVLAMFPLVKNNTLQQEEQSNETFPRNGKLPPNNNPVSSRGLIPRNKREKQLSTYVKTCNDRLGRLVRQRMQDMNNLVKDDQLKMTL